MTLRPRRESVPAERPKVARREAAAPAERAAATWHEDDTFSPTPSADSRDCDVKAESVPAEPADAASFDAIRDYFVGRARQFKS